MTPELFVASNKRTFDLKTEQLGGATVVNFNKTTASPYLIKKLKQAGFRNILSEKSPYQDREGIIRFGSNKYKYCYEEDTGYAEIWETIRIFSGKL